MIYQLHDYVLHQLLQSGPLIITGLCVCVCVCVGGGGGWDVHTCPYLGSIIYSVLENGVVKLMSLPTALTVLYS